MPQAIVLGGSGFVGSACVSALRDAGYEVRAEPAPRLETAARTVADLAADMTHHEATVTSLVALLDGIDVVVNAAGMPAATAGVSDGLFGANALLPALVRAAVHRTEACRAVHLSSVSVQEGMGALDETLRHRAHSPYATSRALGEHGAAGGPYGRMVILRLPSVLGSDSPGQRALRRIARSPLSSTAGAQDRPRPMARVASVGAAVVFLAAHDGLLPPVVLQPTEGFTTRSVLELFGGRRPARIPTAVAKALVAACRVLGRPAPRLGIVARGLELMWLGQDQEVGWLTRAGFVPPTAASGRAAQPLRIGVLTHWYKPELVPNPAPTAGWLAGRDRDVKVLTGFPNYPTGVVYDGYRQRWAHRERDGEVDVRRVPLYASHDTSGVRRSANFLSFAATSTAAGRYLADRDVNYVYSSPMTAAAAAAVLQRLCGVPYVLHSIDLWPDSALESGMLGGTRSRRLVSGVLDAAAAYLYRHAEHIVAVTAGMHQILLDRDVPPEKVSVIHNWSQYESVDRSDRDPEVRARLGRPDRTLAVFAGNVGQMQDVETIVAAAALCQDDTPLDVAVIGAGTAYGPAQRLAEELGAKNVRFFDRVRSAEMPSVYAASDYQLVTLKDRPLFHATVPSKFTDALSAGCPIITNVPGDAARMCRAGGFGFSCAPEDPAALAAAFRLACAADEDARIRMRHLARQFYLSDLSMDTALLRLDAILGAAARSRASRSGAGR